MFWHFQGESVLGFVSFQQTEPTWLGLNQTTSTPQQEPKHACTHRQIATDHWISLNPLDFRLVLSPLIHHPTWTWPFWGGNKTPPKKWNTTFHQPFPDEVDWQCSDSLRLLRYWLGRQERDHSYWVVAGWWVNEDGFDLATLLTKCGKNTQTTYFLGWV